MNKINILLIVCLIFVSTGCDFLEERPNDRLVIDNFYQSEDDANAAITAVYQQLHSLYNRLMYLLCDLPCDGMKNGLGMPNPFLQDIEYLRHNSENTFVLNMWTNSYSGISRANTAINKIPDINMNESRKDRFVGEAKFLRALYYFNLVRFFGDVPLITSLETIEDALIPRTSKTEVYAQIVQDLSDAEKVLPHRFEYADKDEGRATKGAAKILLGKVYLTMKEFEKAKNKLSEVVDHEETYEYGLHAEYGANWNTSTETGSEAVFYIEYKTPPYPNNGEMDLTGPKYSIPGGNIGVAGSNEADIPTQELYDQFENGDKRRDVNLRLDFTNPRTGEVLRSSIPLFGKYWLEGVTASNMCDINMHIIRYADAILMYAEALNEENDIDKALDNINRIRERAFGNSSNNLYNLSKEELRAAILNERRLEFPLEGHRWFDLVRTGTFVERMLEHSSYEANVAESNKTDIAKNLKEYMTLMPIPQREMDLNPQLVQNPGW